MQTWAPILLGNTLLAGVLAIAAIIVMRLRRPAIAHALWLLVLIKLVTPPIWNVPIPRPAWQVNQPSPVVARVEADTVPQTIHFTAPPEMVETTVVIPEGGTLILGSDVPAKKPFQWPSIDSILITLWFGGSILWLLILGVRMRRFGRLARGTTSAPSDLQQRANLLARALELPAAPPIELIPASISPMLWHDIRSTRLLVPEQLLRALEPEQRDALLLHELAHLKRKDHLTRLLEIVVTAIFWWHPLVWIARRGLREAEEQCCDAWVIWAMPNSARRYADALVDTLDFLAASPLSLPPGASGLGGLHQLQRRLTMIFTHTPPRAMSWTGRIAIFGLLGLLPLGPVWSQEQSSAPAGRATSPTTAPVFVAPVDTAVSGNDVSTVRPEQLLLLTGIRTMAGETTAMIENIATGDKQILSGPGRIASGEVTVVRQEGIQYLAVGARSPILIKPGMNLDGLHLDSVQGYRSQLLGMTQPPSSRGGRGPVVLPDLNGGGRALSVEEQMQIRRQFAQVAPQPAQAPQALVAPIAPVAAAPDRAVILALLEATADPDQGVQRNAQQALSGMGTAAVPTFVEATSSASAAMRIGAMKMLSSVLITYAPYGFPMSTGGRRGAQGGGGAVGGGFGGGGGRGGRGGRAGGMGLQGQTASPQALELQATIAPVAVKALEDPEPEVRYTAAGLLVRLIDQPDLAIPAMARLLESDEAVLRSAALTGLSNVIRYRGPERVAPYVPAIIKRLGDRDLALRVDAIDLLGQCGPAAQSAVPELLKVLKDSNASIRAAAATALGQIQSPPPLVPDIPEDVVPF